MDEVCYVLLICTAWSSSWSEPVFVLDDFNGRLEENDKIQSL